MLPNDLLSCVLPVEEFPEINSRAFSSAHCEHAAPKILRELGLMFGLVLRNESEDRI
jgi:hypothetical protein